MSKFTEFVKRELRSLRKWFASHPTAKNALLIGVIIFALGLPELAGLIIGVGFLWDLFSDPGPRPA